MPEKLKYGEIFKCFCEKQAHLSRFSVLFLSPIVLQIYDQESTGEKPVWNEELQKEMVSPHQPRVYLPQNER